MSYPVNGSKNWGLNAEWNTTWPLKNGEVVLFVTNWTEPEWMIMLNKINKEVNGGFQTVHLYVETK